MAFPTFLDTRTPNLSLFKEFCLKNIANDSCVTLLLFLSKYWISLFFLIFCFELNVSILSSTSYFNFFYKRYCYFIRYQKLLISFFLWLFGSQELFCHWQLPFLI